MNSLGRRFGLKGLDYEVPARANRIDFMLGGLTLVALTVLALTGIVLTQYYNPSPIAAHDSVVYIITNTPLAALLRDVHVWSATGAMVFVFAHLAAVFWRRGFRNPREVLWWSGVLLLAMLFALAFTGGVLIGDQGAVEALAHARAGAELIGPLGVPLQESFTVSNPLLTRLYGLHVSVLPLILVGILGLHLWLVRHLGVGADESTRSRFADHLRPLAGLALLFVACVTLLGLLFPNGVQAAGVQGFEVTKPFWPFLFIYAAEHIFGMTGMLIAPALLFGFLAVVPILDRRDNGIANVVRAIGIALFGLLVVAIVYAAVAPGQSHLGM